MKYLLISHTADLNGAERCLLELARGLLKQNKDFIVLCPREGILTKKFNLENIPYRTMMLPRPQRDFIHFFTFLFLWIPTIWRLKSLIIQENITVVYNNTIDGLYAPFAARLVNIPCIWHIHEMKPKNIYGRSFFAWLLKWLPSKVVFSSIATMNAYSTQSYLHWQVVYNGIDMSSSALPLLVDNQYKPIVVGFVGQMVSIKRPDRFIKIFALALKGRSDLYAKVVGTGKLLGETENLVHQLNIRERVEFLGFVDSLYEFYKEIDMLVLTSDTESFGMVLIEAMEAGRPVIASNVGGVPEVVDNGITGYLVAPDDIENFAAKIIELSDDSELRYQMGMAGYKRVRSMFSLDGYQKQLIKLIDELGKGSMRK